MNLGIYQKDVDKITGVNMQTITKGEGWTELETRNVLSAIKFPDYMPP